MIMTLVGAADPARIIAWRHGRAITVARFLGDVEVLAAALPAAAAVVNGCRDRYHFMVALAAAATRCLTTLLPPDQTPGTLAALQRHYPQLVLLHDQAMATDLPCLAYRDGRQQRDSDHNPGVPVDLVVVRVFTSGTTGHPQGHDKTWQSLVRGAELAAPRFIQPGTVLVGTVPPQHMYGLETTILWPLRHAVAVAASQPLLPADICAALAAVPAPRRLITSPVHVRAIVESPLAWPSLAGVISATAPLAPALAAAAERLLDAPVEEIYGATESGSIGARRTVAGPHWDLYPQLRLIGTADQLWVEGGHLAQAVAVNDVLEKVGSHQFIWRGRRTDLVLVAGKRASLAALNGILRGLPGVVDGVFFAPERHGHTTDRLCAFVVSAGATPDAIREALRQQVDPVFLPRPLYCVPALPRVIGVDKLPAAALRDLYDHQPYQLDLWFPACLPVFADHFPGDPLVPGAVLLDALIGGYERHAIGRRVSCVRTFKWLQPLRPDRRVTAQFGAIHTDTVSVTLTDDGGAVMARGQFVVPRIESDGLTGGQ